MNHLPIGLSLCGAVAAEEHFRAYQKAGIAVMELSTGQDGYAATDFAAVARWARAYGIGLWSLHLPFLPFEELNPASPDKAVRNHTVAYFRSLMEKGAEIGIPRYIIHPSGEPNAEKDRPLLMECAKDSLAILTQDAGRLGVTLCVEDLPRTCLGRDASDMLELLSADSRLRVCFDTNHLLTQEPEELVRVLGDKIVTLHVSDYDKIDERHWLPGEGVINWQSLYASLCQVGYSGAWLYELGLQTPEESMVRPRTLTYDDFFTNAREIFGGKAPTALGKALPKLPAFS